MRSIYRLRVGLFVSGRLPLRIGKLHFLVAHGFVTPSSMSFNEMYVSIEE